MVIALRGDGGRHAGVVVPYGWVREDFINHPGRGSPPEPLGGQADGGATGRRRQRNGGFRPSSSVLGKFQEGAGAPSWFPALAAERIGIIFRRGVYVAKNTSQSASVKPVRPNGADRFRVRSDCSFIRFGGFAAKARKFLV